MTNYVIPVGSSGGVELAGLNLCIYLSISLSLSLSIHICVYVYIIYMCIYIYIHIYISIYLSIYLYPVGSSGGVELAGLNLLYTA